MYLTNITKGCYSMKNSYLDYFTILLYLAVLPAIGWYFSRDKKTSENYLLGGRNMPFWAVGMACMMTVLSSISIVTIPGEIFNNSLMLFFIKGTLGMALAIPCYLLFTLFYFRLGSYTPYEYLEFRYDATVRAVVALSSFYTRIVYLGLVLFATAKIFEASYNWSPVFTITLTGVVGMMYTVKGGSKAVIWTDVFQFFVLFGGFIATLLVLCNKIDGGTAAVFSIAQQNGHLLPQFSEADFYRMSPYVRLLFILLLWDAIATPLTNACSDQSTIQRLLSTKNWKEGLKAQVVATLFAFLMTLLLWFAGLALYAYYVQNPDPALGAGKGDDALFRFVVTNLPSPLPGLFIAGMLAAVMSTIAGGANSLATVWLKEIHQKFINRDLSPANEVLVSKFATAAICLFAIVLGLALVFSGKWLRQSVAEVGTLFWLLGAAILPAFLFAVLSRRANAILIWAYTFFAIGEGIAFNCWYALSRSSLQAFERGESSDWGWAGKLDFSYVMIPLGLGIILSAPWLIKTLRYHWSTKVAALSGMLLLG